MEPAPLLGAGGGEAGQDGAGGVHVSDETRALNMRRRFGMSAEPAGPFDATMRWDGASRGNPGHAGAGAVLLDANGVVLAAWKSYLGSDITNSVAEAFALLGGMRLAHQHGITRLKAEGDSKSCVDIVSGIADCKDVCMRDTFKHIRQLMVRFAAVWVRHIPRELNKEADRLANDAMDAADGKVVGDALTGVQLAAVFDESEDEGQARAAATKRSQDKRAKRKTGKARARVHGAAAAKANTADSALILLWGACTLMTAHVRARVCKALADAGLDYEAMVHKVELCVQPNGRARHNVFVPKAHVGLVTDTLNKRVKSFGWLARPHRPWQERVRANLPPRARREWACLHKVARFMTINVCSFSDKRSYVEHFLARQQVTVCAVQEVRRIEGRHFDLRVTGYQVFEVQMRKEREADRGTGVAILVAEGLTAVRLGTANQHFVFVRVAGKPLRRPLVYGCVYVPGKAMRGLRRQVLKQLAQEVQRLMERFSDCDFMLAGDFNDNTAGLGKWLVRQRVPLALVDSAGARATFHRGRKPVSQIDYILASMEMGQWLRKAHVERSFAMSDHWPVVVDARVTPALVEGVAEPALETRFLQPRQWVKACNINDKGTDEAKTRRSLAASVANSNRFEALHTAWAAREAETAAHSVDAVNTMAAEFAQACVAVGTDVGIVLVGKATQQTAEQGAYHVHASERSAIKRCEAAYSAWLDCDPFDTEASAAAEAAYRTAKRSMKYVMRRCRNASWTQFLAQSYSECAGDSKATWSWLDRVAQRRKKGRGGWVPVIDPAGGQVCVEPERIASILDEHYGELFSGSQNAKSDAEWCQLTGAPAEPPGAAGMLDGLMQRVTWPAVMQALSNAAAGKAPGADGVPVEFYKQVMVEESVAGVGLQPDDVPRSALGRSLFKILTVVWESGHVPDSWQDGVLVRIPKRDCDPVLVESYRGICLLQTAVKLLTAIVATNLSDTLEKHGCLVREQGGFRSKQEAVAQSIAVWEVLARRQAVGETTGLAFLDMKQAYDRVSHAGLFAKLRRMGVGGAMYKFIEGLYKSSRMRVRLPDGRLGAPLPLQRGLRQGDALSPVLFLVFINDMLDGLRGQADRGVGVSVPGADEPFIGAMFADDVVIAARSPSGLRRALKLAKQWMLVNEMTLNAKKCGLMCVTTNDTVRAEWHAYFAKRSEFVCKEGVRLPVVREYTYLGCLVTDELRMHDMVLARAKKAQAALWAIMPFLRNRAIPMALRASVLRATAMACGMYGAELFGGCEARVRPLHRVLARGMRAVFGFGAFGSRGSVTAMHHELDIPPVHAVASALVVRAVDKFASMSNVCWLGLLLQHTPAVAAKGSWCARAKRKAATVWRESALKLLVPATDLRVVREVTAFNWMLMDLRVFRREHEAFNQWYLNAASAGAGLGSRVSFWPSWLSLGLVAIQQMRVNGFMSVARLSRFVTVDGALIPARCPFCSSGEAETDAHLVVQCTRWKPQRKRLLRLVIREAKRLLREFPDPDVCSVVNIHRLLLGESVSGVVLVNWLWRSERHCVASDGALVSAAAEARAMASQADTPLPTPILQAESVSIRLARFFCAVLPVRAALMRKLGWQEADKVGLANKFQ